MNINMVLIEHCLWVLIYEASTCDFFFFSNIIADTGVLECKHLLIACS